jgi:hypothetical protein
MESINTLWLLQSWKPNFIAWSARAIYRAKLNTDTDLSP